MPEQLFLGGVASLSGLIYSLMLVKVLVVRVVLAAQSHLASNVLHVGCLMVWLLTSTGETKWLHAGWVEGGGGQRVEKNNIRLLGEHRQVHFSKVTLFFFNTAVST